MNLQERFDKKAKYAQALLDDLYRSAAKARELQNALESLLSVINADKDGGFFICEEAGPIIEGARQALDFELPEAARDYTSGNEHPLHPLVDWRYEVECGYTESGYDTWVRHQIDMNEGGEA